MAILNKIYEKSLLGYYIYAKNGILPKLNNYPVTIEITSVCNLSCKLCPVAKDNRTLQRDVKFIKKEDALKIIELTQPICSTYNLNMWGEPMLDPNVFDYLDILRDKTVYMSTNLNYSTELTIKLCEYENLNLVCSVDGWDEESYATIYRLGGEFEKVLKNLQILSKGKCKLFPQFLMNEYTKSHTKEIFAFIDSIGIDRKNILLNNMNDNFKNEYRATTIGPCHSMHQGFYFHTDGYLVPCCVNIGRDMNVIHISELSNTDELLNGKKVVEFRASLAKDKNRFKSCVGCEQYHVFGRQIREKLLKYIAK